MKILVTAGNTQVPIDKVRCITNIFTGRTGAAIALQAHARGHDVVLLTSHPEVVREMYPPVGRPSDRWAGCVYQTFDDLLAQMSDAVRLGAFDAVIHSAAVSDYLAAGIYAPAANTHFRREDGRWETTDGGPATLVDRAAGKVKSDEPELWLRMVRAPKLIDRVRPDWGFRGVLVKFKLQVGMSDEELLAVAEASRRHSAADLMVANTLEGAAEWAFVGPVAGGYERVRRNDLAVRLIEAVERLHAEQSHG